MTGSFAAVSRFIIGALRAGHYGATEQLAEALPAAGETVDILPDTSGDGPWFYSILDEPLKYRTPSGEDQDAAGPYTWITDIVFRPHNAGELPSFGMRAFPVDLAVVLDPHMRESATVDLERIDFIAVVEIDDADDADHEPPTDTDSAAAADHIPPSQLTDADYPPTSPAAFGQQDVSPEPGTPLADFGPQEVEFPAADFPQEEAAFPEPDFPQEVEFPEPDFPRELAFPEPDFPPGEVDVPEVDFPSAIDGFLAPPFSPPSVQPSPARPPLLLPEPAKPEPSGPEPSGNPFTPDSIAAPRRTSSPAWATNFSTWAAPRDAETVAPPPRPAPAAGKTSSPVTLDPPPARSKTPLVAAGVAAAILVLGGWGFSALQSRRGEPVSAEGHPDSTSETTSSESATSSSRPPSAAPRPEDFAKVTRVLPPGYPPDSCLPAATVEGGGVATLTCGRNDDQGGPPSATYTVFPDPAALSGAFDRAVSGSTQLICPGNIQSPGPWRRNATPQKVAGTLFCGTRGQDPVVIWSDTERMLLSTVQSTPEGPTLDALYGWWTQHS